MLQSVAVGRLFGGIFGQNEEKPNVNVKELKS